MILFDDYTIDKILKVDALGLSNLMASNAKRFQRFFPITLKQNLNLKESKLFVSKKVKEFETNEEFLFTLKANNSTIIGLIYIKELDWEKKQGELAYCIDVNNEGLGLITSAVKKLIEYAFNKLELERLQIIVHKDNLGSVRVAKKCNFIWQRKLLNEHTPPNEDPLDMELYELYKTYD